MQGPAEKEAPAQNFRCRGEGKPFGITDLGTLGTNKIVILRNEFLGTSLFLGLCYPDPGNFVAEEGAMHTAKWNDIEGKAVTDAGAEGVTIRVLMGENVGAPTFTMRHFEESGKWDRDPSSTSPRTRSTTSKTPVRLRSRSCA
jgi:hypothetical protein